MRPGGVHDGEVRGPRCQSRSGRCEDYVRPSDVLQIEIETDNLINESFAVDDFTQRFQKVCG